LRERSTVLTACPLDCWDSCAVLADVRDGRVAALRGDPDHPITRGRLCPKARFQLDRHRDPRRLTAPLVRKGDKLVQASWPAALDLVADKLESARREAGPTSIAHYWFSGSMGLLKNLYQRLFNALGGVTEPRGGLCWSAGLAAQEADFGLALSNAPDDVTHARAVLIWGRNPVDTNPHFVPFLKQARAAGAMIAVIDPLRTATADALGDRHIAPRPGTDAVLALAVAGEILRRGTYDRDFCENRTAGFASFRIAATGLLVDRAAELCGVTPDDILYLSGILETRRPAAFIIGYGPQRYRAGGETVRAIDALAAVTGNVGVRGGGANYANVHAPPVLGAVDGAELAGRKRQFDMPAFWRQAYLARDPEVRMLFVDRANPVAQSPNLRLTLQAFQAIEFKVTVDIRPTDTTQMSDVVLPAADFLEDEDLYKCSWHTYFTWAVPAVPPVGEAWPESRIVGALASRLGLGHEFDRSPVDWITHALEPLAARYPALAPGGDVRSLRGTWFLNPAALRVPWADGRFATPSGLFEFGRAWRSLEGTMTRSPATPGGEPLLRLVTPRHRLSLHSQFYDRVLSRTSRGSGLAAAFLHPATARSLGLDDGQTVVLASEQGELRAHLVMDARVRGDMVVVYAGGGAGRVDGTEPASPNLLTADTLADMGGQAAYYDCLCAVRPACQGRPSGRP